MVSIPIPERSVVICIGGKYDPIEALAKKVPGFVFHWGVNDHLYDDGKFAQVLAKHARVAVMMPYAHPKALRLVAKYATKADCFVTVIALPRAPIIENPTSFIRSTFAIKTVAETEFVLQNMPSNKKHLTGPFDCIGDVHGCATELFELLDKLGYLDEHGLPQNHPEGRTLVFLGDYADRGPRNLDALELVMTYTALGHLAVMGNHEEKLARWIAGSKFKVSNGLRVTVNELEETTTEYRWNLLRWLRSLEPHLVLDGGNLVVAHAGLGEEYHGQHTTIARNVALYGHRGEDKIPTDKDGYPIAPDWAQNYTGKPKVVHGHVVYKKPRLVNNVVAIDTGVVFGGNLTAYQYPEGTFVTVAAKRPYFSKETKSVIPPAEDVVAQLTKTQKACLKAVVKKPKSAGAIMRHAKVKDEDAFFYLVAQHLVREGPLWDGYILTDLGRRVKELL